MQPGEALQVIVYIKGTRVKDGMTVVTEAEHVLNNIRPVVRFT
jgi:hypothetical protein